MILSSQNWTLKPLFLTVNKLCFFCLRGMSTYAICETHFFHSLLTIPMWHTPKLFVGSTPTISLLQSAAIFPQISESITPFPLPFRLSKQSTFTSQSSLTSSSFYSSSSSSSSLRLLAGIGLAQTLEISFPNFASPANLFTIVGLLRMKSIPHLYKSLTSFCIAFAACKHHLILRFEEPNRRFEEAMVDVSARRSL